MSTTLRRRNVQFEEGDEKRSNDQYSTLKDPPDTATSSGSHRSASMSLVPRNTSLLVCFLRKYATFAGNSVNQDKLLKILQYSLWLLSRFYRSKSQHGEKIRNGLAQLSGEISWARFVTRLLGLPAALYGIHQSGISGRSPKAHLVSKAMAWSMVMYYPLENLAYLKWKAPGLVPTRVSSSSSEHRLAERACAWSCRFWLAYIVMDVVRSMFALRDLSSKEDTLTTEGVETTSSSSPTIVERTNERLQVIRNILFTLPAIHWSLPNWDTQPLLSDMTCNTIMWLEAAVCVYQGILNIP